MGRSPARRARARVALGLLSLTLGTGLAQAQQVTADDVRAILTERAEARGAPVATVIRVAQCESRLEPGAVGDSGHSHGLAQLSDLSTGLLGHFRALGYGSPYDAWSAADYLSRVAAGEFAAQGITLRRWSCA